MFVLRYFQFLILCVSVQSDICQQDMDGLLLTFTEGLHSFCLVSVHRAERSNGAADGVMMRLSGEIIIIMLL